MTVQTYFALSATLHAKNVQQVGFPSVAAATQSFILDKYSLISVFVKINTMIFTARNMW